MDGHEKIHQPGGCLSFFLVPACVLLPLIGAFLGYHAGHLVFRAWAQGMLVRWQRLPDPPEKVAAILAADTRSLYVHTAGGIMSAGMQAVVAGKKMPAAGSRLSLSMRIAYVIPTVSIMTSPNLWFLLHR